MTFREMLQGLVGKYVMFRARDDKQKSYVGLLRDVHEDFVVFKNLFRNDNLWGDIEDTRPDSWATQNRVGDQFGTYEDVLRQGIAVPLSAIVAIAVSEHETLRGSAKRSSP